MDVFTFLFLLVVGIPVMLIASIVMPHWNLIIDGINLVLVLILLGGIIVGISWVYCGFFPEDDESLGTSIGMILLGVVLVVICLGLLIGSYVG